MYHTLCYPRQDALRAATPFSHPSVVTDLSTRRRGFRPPSGERTTLTKNPAVEWQILSTNFRHRRVRKIRATATFVSIRARCFTFFDKRMLLITIFPIEALKHENLPGHVAQPFTTPSTNRAHAIHIGIFPQCFCSVSDAKSQFLQNVYCLSLQ